MTLGELEKLHAAFRNVVRTDVGGDLMPLHPFHVMYRDWMLQVRSWVNSDGAYHGSYTDYHEVPARLVSWFEALEDFWYGLPTAYRIRQRTEADDTTAGWRVTF